MAATWEVKIQVVDLPSRTIRVMATRTDGESVRTYSADGKYDTVSNTPKRILAHYTGLFWDLYQAEVRKEGQIATLIGQGETALANALMTKETV